MENKRNSLG